MPENARAPSGPCHRRRRRRRCRSTPTSTNVAGEMATRSASWASSCDGATSGVTSPVTRSEYSVDAIPEPYEKTRIRLPTCAVPASATHPRVRQDRERAHARVRRAAAAVPAPPAGRTRAQRAVRRKRRRSTSCRSRAAGAATARRASQMRLSPGHQAVRSVPAREDGRWKRAMRGGAGRGGRTVASRPKRLVQVRVVVCRFKRQVGVLRQPCVRAEPVVRPPPRLQVHLPTVMPRHAKPSV